MRRLVVGALAAVLVGVLGISAFGEVTIGVACQSMTSSPTRITNAMLALGEEMGWTIMTFDGNGDQQRVNDAAKTWIASGVDAVYILFPPEASLGEVIDAANAAGVPLITTGYGFGRGQTFDVGMNDYAGSVAITSYLFDRLGREGNVVVMHWDVVPVPRQRKAILDAMLSETQGITVVEDHHATLPGHIEDCRRAMESFLIAHPNAGEIDAVWGAWDELTLGAVQAIEAAGRDDIIGVGIDGNLWTFDLIRRGSPFVATIAPDWEQCAEIVVEEVSTNLLGGSAPSQEQFYIDIPLVTINNCPPEGWLYGEWVRAGMPDEPKEE